jgi:hypothetical protein
MVPVPAFFLITVPVLVLVIVIKKTDGLQLRERETVRLPVEGKLLLKVA